MRTVRPRIEFMKAIGAFTFLVVTLVIVGFVGIRRQDYLKGKENMRRANTIDSEDVFRAVEQDIHVHSAFWETRQTPNLVRIIAISSYMVNETKTHTCHLDYGDHTVSTELKKHYLPDHLYFPHGAAYLICETISNVKPQSVAISKKCKIGIDCDEETSMIWKSVKSLAPGVDFKDELAVCVRPFYGPFDDTRAMAEFMAYYEIMGAKHFVFFYYKATAKVKRFLKAIQRDRSLKFMVEVHEWNLPEHVLPFQYGQLVAINYCFHHLMPKYKYVSNVDFDEFMVPRNPRQTLISLVKETDRDTIGTFTFFSYTFCNRANTRGISTVTTHTVRNRLYSIRLRSKSILKPLTVLVQGVHFTHIWTPGFKKFAFNLEVATLNHYREAFCSNEEGQSVIDTYASEHFGNKITNSSVFKIWNTTVGGRHLKTGASLQSDP